RFKSDSCGEPGSKACKEKLQREKLNDRHAFYFVSPYSVFLPGKVGILSDAVRMVAQLRSEAQKLKESNEDLHEKFKEFRESKAMSAQPRFLPHSPGMPVAFCGQLQAAGNKLMPFIGYRGVAMWQFMRPAAVDTSQDHILGPLVA
ncbi:hypothetical protein CFOL_v3_23417, partial [Cephalotus follicularis]